MEHFMQMCLMMQFMDYQKVKVLKQEKKQKILPIQN